MNQGVKYPELEGQIAARGIRKTAIAKRIGCSERPLYSKLSGKTQFACQMLKIYERLTGR